MGITIEQIKEAIEKAKRHESKLSEEALMVPSLTSIKIRHLYNNLGAMAVHFAEIGSHRGGSYCSFVYGNHDLYMATAIDNFSENFNMGDVKGDFLENAKKYTSPHTKWKLIDKDCFTVTPEEIELKVDLYLFDGNHSEESQCKALTYMLPYLTDTFIFIVDDYAWQDVRDGTERGLKETGVEILLDEELVTPEGEQPNEFWHNSIRVLYLKKKNDN